MKTLTLIICLTISTIVGGTGGAFALSPCPSDQFAHKHNCSGPFIETNGNEYVGEWQHNRKHGRGTYIWTSGHKYVGDWRVNMAHGQGTLTYPDGSKYVGEWKGGKRNGQGTHTNLDGSKYVGEMRGDEANGQGTYTFTNGNKYVGEFRNGKFHGQGTYTFADGRVQSGNWENNKFIGSKRFSSSTSAKNSTSQRSEGGTSNSRSTHDVTLPNGRVITDVPIEMTQSELRELAIKNGIATRADFDNAPTSKLSQSQDSESRVTYRNNNNNNPKRNQTSTERGMYGAVAGIIVVIGAGAWGYLRKRKQTSVPIALVGSVLVAFGATLLGVGVLNLLQKMHIIP